MPQMAPMNWIFLFVIFLAIFCFSAMKMFFSLNYTSSSNSFTDLNPLLSNLWKW